MDVISEVFVMVALLSVRSFDYVCGQNCTTVQTLLLQFLEAQGDC